MSKLNTQLNNLYFSMKTYVDTTEEVILQSATATNTKDEHSIQSLNDRITALENYIKILTQTYKIMDSNNNPITFTTN